MRKHLIAIAAAVFALTGCGSDTPAASSPTPTASAATTSAAVAPSARAVNSEAFLAGLRAIDPGLVANEDRAVRRAKDICLDISQDEFTNQQLAARAAERYSGGTATITPAQGARVVALAKANVC